MSTVAVRRERLYDKQGRSMLDFLDLKRYTILPNTAGCYTAEDAIRTARLARAADLEIGSFGDFLEALKKRHVKDYKKNHKPAERKHF